MKEKKIRITSKGIDDTVQLGEMLGKLLEPGDVIAFIGDLGAGKTTMIKGIALGLGVKDKHKVKSPTFSLMHHYKGRIPVYHIDAYRLESAQELINIGSDELFFGDGVSLVEWADNVIESLPEEYLQIVITLTTENGRNIEISCKGKRHEKFIEKIETQKPFL